MPHFEFWYGFTVLGDYSIFYWRYNVVQNIPCVDNMLAIFTTFSICTKYDLFIFIHNHTYLSLWSTRGWLLWFMILVRDHSIPIKPVFSKPNLYVRNQVHVSIHHIHSLQFTTPVSVAITFPVHIHFNTALIVQWRVHLLSTLSTTIFHLTSHIPVTHVNQIISK